MAEEMVHGIGVSMQSGPSVSIAAFGRLPEGIQKQTLENDAQRDRMAFEIEAKNLELMAKDRSEERSVRQHRFDKELTRDDGHDKRTFWFVVFVVGMLGAGMVALCLAKQWLIASHLATAVAALGAGYQGGKSSGFIKAQKQLAAGKSEEDEEK